MNDTASFGVRDQVSDLMDWIHACVWIKFDYGTTNKLRRVSDQIDLV